MARPESNTVDFFPHFISDGKKMFFIEKKYGNDGYATWFKILEKIAVTDYHFLNLNDEQEIIYLSAKCNISEELLLSIINDLSRIGSFDKKLWESKVIWCQKFIDEIQPAYGRRNNKCMTYDSLCKHLIGLCILTVNSNTQSRVDKSRVEVSKDTTVELSTPTATEGNLSPKQKCQLFIDKFNIIRRTATGKKSTYTVTDATCSALNARLKKYTSKDLIVVLNRAIRDDYHVGTQNKHLTPEYILREKIVERYLNQ